MILDARARTGYIRRADIARYIVNRPRVAIPSRTKFRFYIKIVFFFFRNSDVPNCCTARVYTTRAPMYIIYTDVRNKRLLRVENITSLVCSRNTAGAATRTTRTLT